MIILQEIKSVFNSILYSDKHISIWKKWKQSLLAIFLALAMTSILILIKGSNPINIFGDVWIGATKNKEALEQMLLYFLMFILAGLSIIVGFKSGLFNIGIGGQMLISGVSMTIIAVKTELPWPLIILLGMMISAASAALSGVLKSLFNIHEVVSTILINWIFFWISQYLLLPRHSWTNSYGTTLELAHQSRMMINQSIVLPSAIITFSLLGLAIILFNFTKFGYALRAVGENQNASKYAGIKVVFQLSLGMALSGVAAGALASINYLGKFGTMSHSTSQSLPSIGFQGISVALISFNSLLGLIPAAMFWAIITSGVDYASIINPNIPKEVLSLMNGLIIYMIAISIVFIRFKPFKFIRMLYIRLTSEELKKELAKSKKAKMIEKRFFSEDLTRIKTNFANELKHKKLKLSKLQRELKIKLWLAKINFIFTHIKPINVFSKKYKKNLKKYKLELYENTKELDDDLFKIQNIISNNKSVSLKTKIKNNKVNLKKGIAIINNEFILRKINIEKKYQNKGLFAKFLKIYLYKKALALKFEKNKNMIILNFKNEIRDFKKNNSSKDKIKKRKDKLNIDLLELKHNVYNTERSE